MRILFAFIAMLVLAIVCQHAWAQPQPSDPPHDDLKKKLESELSAAAIAEDENPLLSVSRQMRKVAELMAPRDSGPTTQDLKQGRELQERIVADLDRLIGQARKAGRRAESQNGKSQQVPRRTPTGPPPLQPDHGGQNPNENPATTSSPRKEGGKPKGPDMAQVLGVVERSWGNLPQRAREQILELKAEDFVPKYQALIEEYYRRLAEGTGRKDEG
jgi:hypothetical protein